MNPYKRRDAVLKSLGFQSYQAYLQSDLWVGIRKRAMDAVNGKCRLCGKDGSQVHHTEYSLATLRGDTIKTMVVLCAGCHHFIEFHPDGRKTRRYIANRKLNGTYDPSAKHRSRPEIGRRYANRQKAKR